MALTRGNGVLAQVQQQAQQTIRNVQQLQQLQQIPVRPAPRPAPAPRPVLQQVQQQGQQIGNQALQAVRQITQQAQAPRQNPALQQVRNNALSALAMALQPVQPGRGPVTPNVLNRVSATGRTMLTPQQESQLFDQQMQYTKAEAAQYTPMGFFEDPLQSVRRDQYNRMEQGFRNPSVNTRLQMETEILQRMPQMDPNQLDGLSDETLEDIRYSPTHIVNAEQYRYPEQRYDPLSSALPGTPPGASSAAGATDTVASSGGVAPTMTRGVPKGPPPQPYYDPLSSANPGSALVTEAMQGAMTQGNTQSDDGGGGFLDTLGGAVTGALGAFWDAQVWGVNAIKDAASGGYEAFVETPVGQKFVEGLELLDYALDRNKEFGGGMFVQWAKDEEVGYLPGGSSNPLNNAAALPIIAIAEAWEQYDPGIRQDIIDASENGYSSPEHIANLEAAGIDPATAEPQFTGDRAVWEMMMGATDDLPDYVKYPIRIAIELAYDPLTYITGGGAKAGQAVRKSGEAMKAVEGASTGTRVVGTVLQGVGRTTEVIAKAPDAIVELPLAGIRRIGGKTGEVTGLLSTSTKDLRDISNTKTGAAADFVGTAGDALPVPGAGRAFDAQAQGVTPTSGPELIDTPGPAAAPSPGTAAPSAGSAAPNRVDTEVSVGTPPGVSIANDPNLPGVRYTVSPGSGAHTAYVGDYAVKNGTTFIEVSRWNDTTGVWDEVSLSSTGVTGLDRVAASTHADELFSAEIDRVRTTLAKEPVGATVGATASKTGPNLAEVNRMIHDFPGSPEGAAMTPREAAAEKLRLKTLRNDMRAGRVPSDGMTETAPVANPAQTTPSNQPPTTQAERDAAAAAGSSTDTPKSTGAAETVNAAESAKTTKKFPTVSGSYGNLSKSIKRAKRLAKEKRERLPKAVNEILAPQKYGEHEFSPIYGGNRPLDRIVTEAIDSKDPAKLAKAEKFVKEVDDAVQKHLRTDDFYKTWKNGGTPIHLQDDPRFADDFFEMMRVFEPDADPARLRVLANGVAKKALDDLAQLGFRVNHLIPMLRTAYPEQFTLDAMLGSIGRIESKTFRDESAEYLMARYIDTPNMAESRTILQQFLADPHEMTVIADGIHKPYAHSIPTAHQTEAAARLQRLRSDWFAIKRQANLESVDGFDPLDENAGALADAPFRDPDIKAQFDGGLKQQSKGIGQAWKEARAGTTHSVKKTDDAIVNLAMGEIKDPRIRKLLLEGDGKLTEDVARTLDLAMPPTWIAPGYKGPAKQWNVWDAVERLNQHKAKYPDFDYKKALDDAGQLAHGLNPKRTPAELKSLRKAAEAQGIDPKTIVDGTSTMERLAATRGIRAVDWYMRHIRSLLMYNLYQGLPNRIGDVIGNATTHLTRGDVGSALRQAPGTVTTTRGFRKAGRDSDALLTQMAIDTPHMAGAGQAYPEGLIPGKSLDAIYANNNLPPMNEWLKKHNAPRGVQGAATIWTAPVLKDVTTGGDIIGRKMAFDRVWVETYRREALPAITQRIEELYPGQSEALLKQIGDQAQIKAGKNYDGTFSPGDVFAVTNNHQLQRDWQRELNRLSDKGLAESKHLFFSGVNTNADEIARRTFIFHYWLSRASVLYGRTVLQNPFLLNGMYKMYQELQQMAEEDNLPGWLGAMFEFYQSPKGMYLALDPMGILFPTFILDLHSQEGNKLQAFQNLLNPLVGAALGAVGLTQNTPNIFGTRKIENAISDLGNYLKGEGYDLEGIPGLGQFFNNDSLNMTLPSEQFAQWLIGKVNSVGGAFGDFKPFDRQANEEDQLFSIGQSVVIQEAGWDPDPNNWTPEQVAELNTAVNQAMNGDGEETWLSETIRAQYGREGMARTAASAIVPGGVVARQEERDTDQKAAADYWKDFYAGKPTSKDEEAAAARRTQATSADPLWVTMSNEYYQIGTKEQQQQYGVYNDLIYNPEELNPKASIVVDNGDGTYTHFTMAQLAALSEDDRRMVVDAWAAHTTGVAKSVEVVQGGRQEFKAANPEYAQYSTYQKGVHDYPGGISAFRKSMQDNPNFKAAEEAERKRLKEEGKSGAVLEAELDNWADSQKAYFAAINEPWKRGDQISGTTGPSSVSTMGTIFKPEEKEEKEPYEEKDPTVDDYWSPAKGVPRLEDNLSAYDYDNQKMEKDFGPYWNYEEADWENIADTAKERDNLGIGDNTYVTPSYTETMRRYEDWEEDHPGGSPEEFFDYMLQLEGFGRVTPTKPTMPKGGTTYTPGTGLLPLPRR
jgi:hypothetical protein